MAYGDKTAEFKKWIPAMRALGDMSIRGLWREFGGEFNMSWTQFRRLYRQYVDGRVVKRAPRRSPSQQSTPAPIRSPAPLPPQQALPPTPPANWFRIPSVDRLKAQLQMDPRGARRHTDDIEGNDR
jgi:hypothetical protein